MGIGYSSPNIDRCFGGHPGIFMSLGREISLPSDMNIPGCPPQHQSIFRSYFNCLQTKDVHK